jgi:hypothetical protein
MKIIKDVKNNTAFTQFITHNKKTFQLTYNNRNGVPMGFDYRFQAQIKSVEDLWQVIVGKNDIGFNPISYASSEEQREQDSKRFVLIVSNL